MNNKRFAVFTSLTLCMGLALSGCQFLTGYNKIDDANKARYSAQVGNPIEGEITITCKGTYHCEIVQIGETPIISSESHEPVDPTMLAVMRSTRKNTLFRSSAQTIITPDTTPLPTKTDIKIVPLSVSNLEGLTNYYLRAKPGKHEVQVNFYPESNIGYIERFAMIHEFTQPGSYELRAYRKKLNNTKDSLLENASPSPLCVDLTYNGRLQRQFCKQDGTKRQGEFIEGNASDTI